jgi:hypothetical protein
MNESPRAISTILPSESSPASSNAHRGVTIALSVFLVAGFLVYAICLFKHIGYPLMWADESMVAVGAERVLEYGYPKVHDGRNVFYDLRHNDMTLGIDTKTDAYIGGAGWTPYYFTAPFVVLSRLASDLYLKTAILRVPFAFCGLAGLLLLLWTATRSVDRGVNRLVIGVLFIVMELPSVTLMLHLREVRYYSLQLLLTVAALSFFAAYHLHSSIKYHVYAVAVIILPPLLFLTFSPASVAFCATTCLYLGGEWMVSRKKKQNESTSGIPHDLPSIIKILSPVLISLVLVAPLASFFRTFYISRQLEEFYGFSLDTYLEHLNVVFGYFARYDIMVFAVAAKLTLALFWRRLRAEPKLLPAFRLSLLLSLYFILHALIVAKIPNELFTRYFITLQPILVTIFSIDLMILARLSFGKYVRRGMVCAAVAAMLFVFGAGWAYSENSQLIRGRLYEIRDQYQGVLDFVIPYIKEHFEHPDQLIIATNYEETSYIFYLDCRVIVGFLNPDFRPDRLERPDCIVYRSFWSEFTDTEVFYRFLRNDKYNFVRFPVLDSGFNNIPETVHWTPGTGWGWYLHFFTTAYSSDPERQTTLYIRKDAAGYRPPVRNKAEPGTAIYPRP